MQKINKLIATVFYVGYLPFAPGTAASVLAAGVYFLIKDNPALHLLLTVVFLALGFLVSSAAEKDFGGKDPRRIVIDEFAAMLMVYLFLPFSVSIFIAGFVLFRIFDIFKIPAIKKLERLPAGWGIMLDDIAAALFTNLLLQVLALLPVL